MKYVGNARGRDRKNRKWLRKIITAAALIVMSLAVSADAEKLETKTENQIAENAGTYVVSQEKAPFVEGFYMYGDTARNSQIIELSKYAFYYIEETCQVDGEEWGRIDYYGLQGWIPLDYVQLISKEDYRIQSGEWCTINTSYEPGIALRSEPNEDSEMIRRVPHGTTVKFSEFQEGWGKTIYDGQEVWISMKYVSSFQTHCCYEVQTQADYGIKLRSEPSANSKEMGTVKNGYKVTFSEIKNGWGKFEYEGNVYWMDMAYMIPTVSEA